MVYNRAFGVEIEFKGSRAAVARAIRNLGVACEQESYNHNTRNYWKIVTDASLGYDNAGEVVSPILQGEQGLRELELVCEGLSNAGATVDRRCGLHIHLDSRDMTAAEIKTVFTRYADYESQIDRIMPRSRRGNAQWCQTLNGAVDTIKASSENKSNLGHALGRYYKVNLTNIANRGSIEFRQHSGTTDYTKIVNWLTFLQEFIDTSIRLTGCARQRTVRTKQRIYGQLRTYFESTGGDVKWSRKLKLWIFSSPETRTFALSNQQIETLYPADSRKMNTGLRDDWQARVGLMGGSVPWPAERMVEDSLTEGLTSGTVDWLQQRAAELN